MKILFVNPEFPVTYWGFQYTLDLAGKHVNVPPLGLVTVAALLPQTWELRLTDINIRPLTDQELLWADVVFLGGMRIQAKSMHAVIRRAHALDRRVVVGGPAPTTSPEEYLDADWVFCGELEGRESELVAALATPTDTHVVLKRSSDERPELLTSPLPRFDLLQLDHYAVAAIQFSRGCPFSCEFCDIVEIFGHRPRTKEAGQVVRELATLLALGFHGSVFLVDDNFIGNKKAVRRLLPEITAWQQRQHFPFELFTEASLNLASDPELAHAMVAAGFTAVFVGIETPAPASLAGAGKTQNLRLDMVASVDRLTAIGLEVMGGFIVGFDQDDPTIFARQSSFIEATAIPMAMVGLLTALPGTALWRRLKGQGRLRSGGSGDQFERPNFEPAMDERTLLQGYADLLAEIYTPAAYYGRCAAVMRRSPKTPGRRRIHVTDVMICVKALWSLGIRSSHRRHFWSLLALSLRSKGKQAAWAISQAIKGEHLIRYTFEHLLPRIHQAIVDIDALRSPVPVLDGLSGKRRAHPRAPPAQVAC